VPAYRLDLEYDGTRYHGWQEQRNARSVAGELRRAITGAGGSLIELGGSGRTDAGVHALAQTAHLRMRAAVDLEPFRRAVNDALPPDIHVLSLRAAGDSFHARHDAVGRVYLYQVARRRAAFAKRHVWWVKRPLDAAAMRQAARAFEGRHDFRAWCERPQDQPSTLVVLERAEVAEAGALILVRLSASHFLWKMVRRIVGVLVRVGAGEMTAAEAASWLDPRGAAREEEGPATWTAPPSGLFLERVIYPGEPGVGPPAPAVAVPGEPGPRQDLFTGRPVPAPAPSKAPRRAPPPGRRPGGRRASRG
jgi:tRNA pseudouridine38-40 synthase